MRGLASLALDALLGVRLGYEPSENVAFKAALVDLERAGAVLVEMEPSDAEVRGVLALPVFFNEFKFGINRYLTEEAGPNAAVSDLTEIILYNQEHPNEVQYGQDFLIASDGTPGNGPLADVSAIPVMEAARAAGDRLFVDYELDAIIGPNTISYTFAAEAGYPAVVVPAGYSGQTPQGLMFLGPMRSDAELLSYAYAYEQASQRRLPPEAINSAPKETVCGRAQASPTGH